MNGHDDRMHDDMLDLVAVYALGALGEAEAETVRSHLAGCDFCRAEFAALRPAADAVGYSAEAPLDELTVRRMRVRLMTEIAAQATPAEAPVPRRIAAWPAYLVAAAAIVFGLLASLGNQHLRAEIATLQQTNAALAQRQAALERRAADASSAARRDERLLAALADPAGKRFAVHGGTIVASGDRLYVTMRDMPAPPKGKVYQIWTSHDGKTVAPNATFMPDRSGRAVVGLAGTAAGTVALAVSLEPEGGSKQPTSKPLFIRKLS